MIVTLSSVGGAPGVTSWTLLLAAAWPDPSVQRVVLEADPSGGVLGSRYGLGVDPGAVGLVASCRRDAGLDVDAHGRLVAEGVLVVPAPELEESAHPLWMTGASSLATAMTVDDKTWLVDLGRLGSSSPCRELASVAALNIVLARPETEQLVRVPARVASLREFGSSVAVLVLGSSGYDENELREFFDADRVWSAPASAQLPQLVSQAIQGGRARRHVVWRNARNIAAEVAELATKAALSRDALALGTLS